MILVPVRMSLWDVPKRIIYRGFRLLPLCFSFLRSAIVCMDITCLPKVHYWQSKKSASTPIVCTRDVMVGQQTLSLDLTYFVSTIHRSLTQVYSCIMGFLVTFCHFHSMSLSNFMSTATRSFIRELVLRAVQIDRVGFLTSSRAKLVQKRSRGHVWGRCRTTSSRL